MKKTSEPKTKTTKKQKQAPSHAKNSKASIDSLVNGIMESGQATSAAPASPPATAKRAEGGARPHRTIKLGIDVPLDRYVVVRQIDGGAAQPPQSFTPAKFLEWAEKQLTLAEQVFSCYEAGPLGYGWHRKLIKFGLIN